MIVALWMLRMISWSYFINNSSHTYLLTFLQMKVFEYIKILVKIYIALYNNYRNTMLEYGE